MVEIVLVPVIEAEIHALQILAHATWEPTYGPILSQEQVQYMYEEIYTEAAIKEQMHKGQTFYFIQAAAENIGFLSLTCIDPEEGRFKLNKIYMLPHFQGQGIGKKALAAAEELARKRHGKILELNVNRFNKARNFYERCGYAVIREEDIPIGPYFMNDFVLEKKLT